MIYGDAQDLSIKSRELGAICLVGRDLARSYRGPGKGKECEYHIFPLKVTQGHLFIEVTRQSKIWCRSA